MPYETMDAQNVRGAIIKHRNSDSGVRENRQSIEKQPVAVRSHLFAALPIQDTAIATRAAGVSRGAACCLVAQRAARVGVKFSSNDDISDRAAGVVVAASTPVSTNHLLGFLLNAQSLLQQGWLRLESIQRQERTRGLAQSALQVGATEASRAAEPFSVRFAALPI